LPSFVKNIYLLDIARIHANIYIIISSLLKKKLIPNHALTQEKGKFHFQELYHFIKKSSNITVEKVAIISKYEMFNLKTSTQIISKKDNIKV
jgi:hypothetical protein